MRLTLFLLAFAGLGAAAAPDPSPAGFVQAVEFPYYLCPADLWERELLWLKSAGIRTVEFSVPWNWHQLQPGEFDLTGRTSPRRDLAGFIRLLRRLGLRAWIRPLPPVPGWLNNGWPAGAPPGGAAQRAWLAQLTGLLRTQTASHGGPVAFVEGRALAIDAPAPPAAIAIPASDPSALARSRQAIAAARGGLLWTGVEDAVYPAGWAAEPGPLLRPGAIAISGEEISTGPLRRDSTLLRNWSRLIARMRPAGMPKPAAGKLPDGVRAIELVSREASAVSITNSSKEAFHDELRVRMPGTKRTLTIPNVSVAPGESLWLPLSVSLGPDSLCAECSNFSAAEHIVYATAELVAVEYENGVFAMEFAAPEAGEVVVQLAREPAGPFLAAGRPADFEWDEKTLRARFKIPANRAPGNRVRIGVAMEAPDSSAFFSDAHRLLIGRANTISTIYSSAALAGRSRLRLPEGYSAKPTVKSPNEIDYEVTVPSDAVHGDWANLTIEADGMPLGRTSLQLFHPASVRLSDPVEIHFGQQAAYAAEPAIVPIDPSGADVDVIVRNNTLQIQTYGVEFSGSGLNFTPGAREISVGALDQRSVRVHIAPREGTSGVRDWRVRLTGGAETETAMRAVIVPRDGASIWSADLDGDGSPEWVLESRKVRAVFSAQDGGRWMELTAKASGTNFLPEAGAFLAPGPVEVRAVGDALEFSAKAWKRTVRLSDNTLTIEQTSALPPDRLAAMKRGSTTLTIERPSGSKAIYTLK
jgi:hypothetical protein